MAESPIALVVLIIFSAILISVGIAASWPVQLGLILGGSVGVVAGVAALFRDLL